MAKTPEHGTSSTGDIETGLKGLDYRQGEPNAAAHAPKGIGARILEGLDHRLGKLGGNAAPEPVGPQSYDDYYGPQSPRLKAMIERDNAARAGDVLPPTRGR